MSTTTRLCQSLLDVADTLDSKGNFKLAQHLDDLVGKIKSPDSSGDQNFLDLFRKELERHDWLYDFSDDFRVYQLGMRNEKRLLDLAKDMGPEAVKLFNQARNQAFERVRK